MTATPRPRVLSGMRPTGPLHLGHLVGALKNWVALQDTHDCFFTIVDWHALTTDYADPSAIRAYVREVTLDWLSCGHRSEARGGLRPVRGQRARRAASAAFDGRSAPVAGAGAHVQGQQEQLRDKDLNTYGFLGYPLLQAADILAYRARAVPVGDDQVPHLELCREIARRFNHLYGDVFPEPQALLTQAARLPGTDGRKMSKSYGNAIFLSDDRNAVHAKVDAMLTDPQRTHRHIRVSSRGLPGVRDSQSVLRSRRP